MKKLLFLLLIPQFLFAQNWIDKMQDPSHNFYDTQKEFNDYWKNKTIEKGKGWKQFKRWENFIEQRVFPDGIQHPELLLEEYNSLQQSNNQFKMLPPNIWSQVGPNNVPLESSGRKRGIGRVNTIAFHPTDANIIYVGAPAGGFWKSVNGGQTWQTSTDFLANLGVSDIAIHPTNPDTIYIITGDRDGGDTYAYGLLKSYDGGITWQTTSLSFNVTQYYKGNRVLIDPNNPNVLIVATSNGIYRSVDGGNTFANTFSISITSMEFHTTNSNVIYGGSKGSTSVYKSSDNGITWTQAGTGLPSTNSVVRACVGVTIDNPSVVYALFGGNNNGFYGVYKSNDEGQTWTQQANSPNLLGWSTTGSDSDGQAWYDLAFEVSPTDQNTLFVGGVNCWKSTDGGVNWNINTHWYGGGGATYMHADEHMLKYNPLNNYVYSGNDGGLYFSADNGNNWTDISDGLQITQFYSLGVSQTVQDKVITGSQDNGTFLKTAANWDAVIGGDGMECIIDYTNANIMYGEVYYGAVRKSTNGGNSFSSIAPANNGAWETPYELDRNNPQIMYIGYDELHKTTDGGNNWNIITNNETNGGKIDEIGMSKSNSNVIYFSDGANIFTTTNGGSNWNNITNNLPYKTISYIIVHPTDANKVWVTLSGYTSSEKVYKTIDGGNTWVNISGTLPNIPVNCIVLDESNNLESLYIGTDLGVFTTDSTITDWNMFNNNSLPNVIVSELEIQYQSNKLIAATYGRGLWSIDLQITSPPIADFSYSDSVFCNVPAVVSFFNNSYYSNAYFWDFGDGNTSTSTNPTHTYLNYGTYTVSLIASGPLGVDSIIYQSIISINPNNPCIITLPPSGAGVTQTGCNGILYDVGGPNGNYYDNNNSWITIAPQGSSQITLNFTSFDIEAPSSSTNCNWDYLEIFDGADTSANSLGQYCNTLTGSPGTLVSSGGSLTVYLHADQAVNGSGFEANWTCIFPATPPVTAFSLSDTVSCNTTINFTDLSSNGPSAWLWDFGDGNTSILQNPTHTYQNSGIYTIKLIATNQYGSDSLILINYLNIIDLNLQTVGATACGSSSLTLTALVNNTNVNWYSDVAATNLLATGNSFVTPILNTTTSYYAQSSYDFPILNVGPAENNFGSGSYFQGDRHLIFDNYKSSTLKSVLVYADSDGYRTIELRNSSNAVLNDTSVFIPTSPNGFRVNLNFSLPVQNNMQLGISAPNSDLYRNDANAVFPYIISDIISITGTNASAGYYYFFYDWEVQQDPCISAIATVDAIINNSTTSTLNVTECDFYTWNGQVYITSVIDSAVFTNANNCDSTVILNLTISSSTSSTSNVTDCNTYSWNGTAYSSSGVYTYLTTNANGCDSTATLSLTINNSTTSTANEVACDIYSWNGAAYSSSGVYTYSTTNSNGCDSTATLDLTITPFVTSTTAINSCVSYTWNGTTYIQSGIYSYSGPSIFSQLGQDINGEAVGDVSGRSVSLSDDGNTVAIGASENDGNGSNSGHVRIYNYNGVSWNQLGNDIDGETANDYSGHSISLSGDGSILAIGAHYNDGNGSNSGHVRIYNYNGVSWSQLGNDIDGEASDDYSGSSVSLSDDGNTVAIGAHYNDGNGSNSGHVRIYNLPKLTNSNGCDSIATLNLTIKPATTSTSNVTACDTYSWNGTTYTSGGTYTDSTTNSNGCDSTVTLNLIISNSTSNTATLVICDSYIWLVNGTTYTASGIYTDVSTNASGCTHAEILNLTINPSTTSTTFSTECDTYSWNGTTYTSDGTYTYSTTNSNGCDSTATLNLTIHPFTTSSSTITECDSYTWNNTTYTASGIQTWLGINANGCDSTTTLNLTINPSATSSNISGASQVFQGATESYVPFPSNSTSVYLWGSTLNSINYTSPSGDSIVINFITSTNELIYFIETTSDGCIGDTVWMQIIVEFHTSINQTQIDDINIYPNPSLDIFNVEFISLITQNLQVKIINSIGDVVFMDSSKNYIGEYKKQINLGEYSNAIYFLEIQTDNGVINQKLILQ